MIPEGFNRAYVGSLTIRARSQCMVNLLQKVEQLCAKPISSGLAGIANNLDEPVRFHKPLN